MEVQVQHLRRPLQPKNIQWETEPKPKAKRIEAGANAGKENRPFKANALPLEASLAEELRVARRRRERLRLERERAERLLKERGRELERRVREMEMRWGEQKKMELEIQRIFWIMDLRSCVRVAPIQSLRAKEEEKRNAQLKIRSTIHMVSSTLSHQIKKSYTTNLPRVHEKIVQTTQLEANRAESMNGSGDPGQLSPQEKGEEN